MKATLKIIQAACAWVILLFIVGILIHVLSGMNKAQRICENLLQVDLLNNSTECLISWDYQKYLPIMFPSGVSKAYVEKGMQGFYLESDFELKKLYLLRQTPPTRLTWFFSQQVVFVFDQAGKLISIEFEFF